MKIRSGFVSNSSSSSFVVLLPDGFNANKIDFSKAVYMHEDNISEGAVKDAIENLLAGDTIYEYDNYGIFNAVTEILSEYIVATMEGGPEAGQILKADNGKVRGILK